MMREIVVIERQREVDVVGGVERTRRQPEAHQHRGHAQEERRPMAPDEIENDFHLHVGFK
jgi:hypothetical protein